MSEAEYMKHVHEGFSYFYNNDYKEAINHFNKATEEIPENGEPYYLIAQCYEALALIDDAKIKKEIQSKIAAAEEEVKLEITTVNTSNIEYAADFYIKAVERSPYNTDIRNTIMQFWRPLEFIEKETEIKLFDKWLEFNDQDYEVWNLKGSRILFASNWNLPEEVFEEALKSFHKVLGILQEKYDMTLDQMILNIKEKDYLDNNVTSLVTVSVTEQDANILANTINSFFYISLFGHDDTDKALGYALDLKELDSGMFQNLLEYLIGEISLNQSPSDSEIPIQKQKSQYDEKTDLIHNQTKPLFQFEGSLKSYIANKLFIAFGKDWWYDAIASNFRAEAERRKQLDVKSNPKAKKNPVINYLDLKPLKATINFPRNWNRCFREDFKSIEKSFNNDFEDLIGFRHILMHVSRRLSPEEDDRMRQIIGRITSYMH